MNTQLPRLRGTITENGYARNRAMSRSTETEEEESLLEFLVGHLDVGHAELLIHDGSIDYPEMTVRHHSVIVARIRMLSIRSDAMAAQRFEIVGEQSLKDFIRRSRRQARIRLAVLLAANPWDAT